MHWEREAGYFRENPEFWFWCFQIIVSYFSTMFNTKFFNIHTYLSTFLMVLEVMVEGKNQVWTNFYYITEMFFINNFFSWQLFSEFLKFIQKSSLVRTLWNFQGVKKVCWKKSYSPFSVSLGGGRGESSSSKCPRPAQVDFNSDFRVVGSNPGWNFQKFAL